MYPNLLAPLLGLTGLLALALLGIVVLRPVSRRLAFRQVARRRSEAVLAVIGATLGTAIIVGALVVGDTLNFSVKQDAYRTLGPVDERVVAADAPTGQEVARRLAVLRTDPDVDGVLTAQVAQAAGVSVTSEGRLAEPRVLAWQTDFGAAARFGSAAGPSGLSGPAPARGSVVVNAPLARSLNLRPGDQLTLYLYGVPSRFTVARVTAERGLAGAGLGAQTNRNVFLPAGTLTAAAARQHRELPTVTFVSNRGGVEAGAGLTDRVSGRISELLRGVNVFTDQPKRTTLDAARQTGDALGALFLMIGSFSIIAGALLLVNIFVMLGEERRSQLGMLRAVGMKRARLVESFTLEGACYAVAAVVPGVVVGLGVGWAVALVSAQIFRTWSVDGGGLSIRYAVTPTSVLNGIALGFIIAVLTIVASSVRISRFNIIAAIRDAPAGTGGAGRRRIAVSCAVLAVLFGLLSIPAIASSQAETTLLLPALAVGFALPLASRYVPFHRAATVASAVVMVWTMVASVVRPDMFDNPSMAIYVIQGTLIAFAGVALISLNQDAVTWPLRRLAGRPTQGALATRLALAYPLAKRFRTGATLIMYALITLVLTLLVQITGVINKSVDRQVENATSGYALRVDLNPASASTVLGRLAADASPVTRVTPLVSALGTATDPGGRASEPLKVVVVGAAEGAPVPVRLRTRLDGYATDAAVYRLVQSDPRYVLLDAFFGQTGGPNGDYYGPGDTFTVTDPATGRSERKVIAGILSSGLAFYPTGGSSANAYPVVESGAAVRAQFGPAATVGTALVAAAPGTDADALRARLQARFLSASLIATPLESSVRRLFAANTAFFRLMQGFLALGLVVGITGLGVVMVRAVRERRRTIGVLRALGFQARTIERSFLTESALIALQGVVLGALLGLATTWLMYQKSAAFDGVRTGFPIQWQTLGVLIGATLVASVLATLAPARRAARIRPALAVRVSD